MAVAVTLVLGGCDTTGSGGPDAPGLTAFAGFWEGATAPATAAALGGLIGPRLSGLPWMITTAGWLIRRRSMRLSVARRARR